MDRWVGKVAVVTGTSAGIGAGIAEALVREGMLVVGLARRAENTEKLAASLKGAKGKLYARRCDVGKEEDLQNAFDWVQSELGGIDVLVNNAGVVQYKKFLDDDIESYRNIMDVNFLATAIGIRKAVASMQSRQVAGHIININSIAGHPYAFLPTPVSVYGSSKFAVTSLTDTVRKELAAENSGIKMTSLSPGYVKTDLADNSPELAAKPHYLRPKDIADAVVYLLGTPEHVQVTEFTVRPICETY